jgi:hypothetical protein
MKSSLNNISRLRLYTTLWTYLFVFILFFISSFSCVSASLSLLSSTSSPYDSYNLYRGGRSYLSQNPINYLSTSILTSFPSQQAFTVMFWMKSSLPNQFAHYFWYEVPQLIESNAAISLYSYGDMRFTVYGSTYIQPNMTVMNGAWHHVAVTFNPVKNQTMFFQNGRRVGDIHPANKPATRLGVEFGRLVLCKTRWNDKYFGHMDDFAIFRAGLSEQHIHLAYVHGVDYIRELPEFLDNDPVYIYYRFDAITNSRNEYRISDYSGHDRHAVFSFGSEGNVLAPSRAPIFSSSHSVVHIPTSTITTFSITSIVMDRNFSYIKNESGVGPIPSGDIIYANNSTTTTFNYSGSVELLHPIATDSHKILCGLIVRNSSNLLLQQLDESNYAGANITAGDLILHPLGFVIASLLNETFGNIEFQAIFTTNGINSTNICSIQNLTISEVFQLKIYPNVKPTPNPFSLSARQDTSSVFSAIYDYDDGLYGIDPEGDDLAVYVTSLPTLGNLAQVSEHGDISAYILTVPTRVENSAFKLAFIPDTAPSTSDEIDVVDFSIMVADYYANSSEVSINVDVLNVFRAPSSYDQNATARSRDFTLIEINITGISASDIPIIEITELPLYGMLYQVDPTNTSNVGQPLSFENSDIRVIEQWVHSVPAVSSSWSTLVADWSYENVYGPPDVFPSYGRNPKAWAGRDPGSAEWIWLHYASPLYLKTIEVYETYNPGRVSRISVPNYNLLSDADAFNRVPGWSFDSPTFTEPTNLSEWKTIWSSNSASAAGSDCGSKVRYTTSTVFTVDVCRMPRMVQDILIHFSAVPSSWVEIDAVKIIGTRDLPANIIQSEENKLYYAFDAKNQLEDTFSYIVNSCLYWNSYRNIKLRPNEFTLRREQVTTLPIASDITYYLELPVRNHNPGSGHRDLEPPNPASPSVLLENASKDDSNVGSIVLSSSTAGSSGGVSADAPPAGTVRHTAKYSWLYIELPGTFEYEILLDLRFIITRSASLGDLLLSPPNHDTSVAVDPSFPARSLNNFTLPKNVRGVYYKTSFSCLKPHTPSILDRFDFRIMAGDVISEPATVTVEFLCTNSYLLTLHPDPRKDIVGITDDFQIQFGNLSTAAPPVGRLLNVGNISYALFQRSGVPLDIPLLISVNDCYNNPIPKLFEWKSFFRIKTLNGHLFGRDDHALVDGIADFSDYSLILKPGNLTSIYIQTTLDNGIVLSTPLIHVFMLLCEPGTYVQNGICVSCPPGYTTRYPNSNTTCEVVPEYTSIEAVTIISTMAAIGISFCLICMAIVITCRRHRIIFSLSPVFLLLTLLGLSFVFASALVQVAHVAVPVCNAAVWLFNIGFTLTFGAIFAKTFRLYAIFGNPVLRSLTITNRQLLKALAIFLAYDIIIIILWQTLSPYIVSEEIYPQCKTSGSKLYSGFLIAEKGLLLLYGAFLTYQVSGVPSNYNESKWLGLSLYNIGITSAVMIGSFYGLYDQISPINMAVLISVGTLFGGFSTLVLLFGHIFFALFVTTKVKETFCLEMSGAGLGTLKDNDNTDPFGMGINLDSLVLYSYELKNKENRHPLEMQLVEIITSIEKYSRNRAKLHGQLKTALTQLSSLSSEIAYQKEVAGNPHLNLPHFPTTKPDRPSLIQRFLSRRKNTHQKEPLPSAYKSRLEVRRRSHCAISDEEAVTLELTVDFQKNSSNQVSNTPSRHSPLTLPPPSPRTPQPSAEQSMSPSVSGTTLVVASPTSNSPLVKASLTPTSSHTFNFAVYNLSSPVTGSPSTRPLTPRFKPTEA